MGPDISWASPLSWRLPTQEPGAQSGAQEARLDYCNTQHLIMESSLTHFPLSLSALIVHTANCTIGIAREDCRARRAWRVRACGSVSGRELFALFEAGAENMIFTVVN